MSRDEWGRPDPGAWIVTQVALAIVLVSHGVVAVNVIGGLLGWAVFISCVLALGVQLVQTITLWDRLRRYYS